MGFFVSVFTPYWVSLALSLSCHSWQPYWISCLSCSASAGIDLASYLLLVFTSFPSAITDNLSQRSYLLHKQVVGHFKGVLR